MRNRNQDNYRPFIVDVEASGFGSHSYPIEIGLALSEGSRYCSLIAPADHWTHWDTGAEKVHGIPRAVLVSRGKAMEAVARDLNGLLEGQVVYTDGWAVDNPWITRLFSDTRINKTFRVSPLELILKEEQMGIWHETKEKIISALNLHRHRASTDAFIIQETFIQTAKLVCH